MIEEDHNRKSSCVLASEEFQRESKKHMVSKERIKLCVTSPPKVSFKRLK